MNAVSFGLPQPAYFNLDYAGSDTALTGLWGSSARCSSIRRRWRCSRCCSAPASSSSPTGLRPRSPGELAQPVAQHPPAGDRSRACRLLVRRRAHALRVCSPVLFSSYVRPDPLHRRRRLSRTLRLDDGCVQGEIEAGDLGDYWTDENATERGRPVRLADWHAGPRRDVDRRRPLRADIIQGRRPAEFYRRLAAWSLGIGVPLSILGVAIHLANDWNPDVALVGAVPNILATVPMAIGYIALITLWNQRDDTRLQNECEPSDAWHSPTTSPRRSWV